MIIEEGITEINEKTFKNCYSLKSLVVPNSVIKINKGAFSGCSSLEKMELPFIGRADGSINVSSEETKFGYIFGDEYYDGAQKSIQITNLWSDPVSTVTYYVPMSLKDIRVDHGVIYWLAFSDCDYITKLTIGGDVKEFGGHLFYNSESLTDLIIEEGIKQVFSDSFRNCLNLKNITLPKSIKSFGSCIFYNCPKISNIYYHGDIESWCNISLNGNYGYLRNFDNFYMYQDGDYQLIEEIIIPDSIDKIGNYQFYGFKQLKKIVIPGHINTIGSFSFQDNNFLEEVYFDGTLKDWCEVEFGHGNAQPMAYAKDLYLRNDLGEWYLLTEVVLSEGTEIINNYTFEGVDNLEEITLPSTIKTIGNFAFNKCQTLTNVYYKGTMEDWLNIDFISASSNPMMYATNFYYLKDDQFVLLEEVVIPESITKIKNYQLYGFSQLKKVIFHDNITEIGDRAFIRCSGLSELILPKSLTTIKDHAFKECINVKSIELFKDVASIGDDAFNSIFGIETVKYYGTLDNWMAISFPNHGSNPLHLCADLYLLDENSELYLLEELVIDSSFGKVNDYQFSGCSSITKLVLEEGISSIGVFSFINCGNLDYVYLPNSLENIANRAFENYGYLTSFYYYGSQDEFSLIDCKWDYEYEFNVIYYYLETTPQEEGNYWHYDENNNPVIWSN